MTKFRWLAALLFGGAVLCLAATDPVAGQDGEEPLTKEEEAQRENLQDLLMAHRLAAFAKAYKAPEALVTAGGLLLKVNSAIKGEAKVDASATDEKGNTVEAVKAKSLKEEAADLFDAALGMKPGSKELQAMIKAARTRDYKKDPAFADRGVVGGPKRISKRVDAGGRQHFNLKFASGQPGSVALTSSAPVRFIVRAGGSTLTNTVVTHFHYTLRASGKSGATKGKGGKAGATTVAIEVHGMGRPAQFTLLAQ